MQSIVFDSRGPVTVDISLEHNAAGEKQLKIFIPVTKFKYMKPTGGWTEGVFPEGIKLNNTLILSEKMKDFLLDSFRSFYLFDDIGSVIPDEFKDCDFLASKLSNRGFSVKDIKTLNSSVVSIQTSSADGCFIWFGFNEGMSQQFQVIDANGVESVFRGRDYNSFIIDSRAHLSQEECAYLSEVIRLVWEEKEELIVKPRGERLEYVSGIVRPGFDSNMCISKVFEWLDFLENPSEISIFDEKDSESLHSLLYHGNSIENVWCDLVNFVFTQHNARFMLSCKSETVDETKHVWSGSMFLPLLNVWLVLEKERDASSDNEDLFEKLELATKAGWFENFEKMTASEFIEKMDEVKDVKETVLN